MNAPNTRARRDTPHTLRHVTYKIPLSLPPPPPPPNPPPSSSSVLPQQCGFALLEAGSVRAKNTKNILLKNVLDACLGGIIWWTIGYPIALGDMGTKDTKDDVTQPFFMDRIEGKSTHTYYAMWMFQWAFAATAATIVSVRYTTHMHGCFFFFGFLFFFFSSFPLFLGKKIK